jgi:cytochrome c peroxidase
LFWDGRAANLESQALAPLTNPVEHALGSEAGILEKVRADSIYVHGFERLFNVTSDQLNARQVAEALAAFERTLIAAGSPFDRYLYAGDRSALTPPAIRGLELFRGRGQCVGCHTIQAASALFTDGLFHITPIGLPPGVNARLGKLTKEVVAARNEGRSGQVEKLLATDADFAALGRFIVTLDPQDIGRFKTPSLRNVALTAPYMHDGSVKTLEKAIDLELYGRVSAQTVPITLTRSERAELLEFLQSLTSQPLPADR